MASSEASSMYIPGLPASRFPLGTLRLKENAPELDWCWRPAALWSKSRVMTCPRTAAAEETELLTVLKIPFRVVTPSLHESPPAGSARLLEKLLPWATMAQPAANSFVTRWARKRAATGKIHQVHLLGPSYVQFRGR